MFTKITRGVVCAAMAVLLNASSAYAAFGVVPDGRILNLERFFTNYHYPSPHYSADYIRAADTHKLDYRLLPAISLVESTCGVHEQRNNRWGWNSGKKAFASIPTGIYFITSQLAQGFYYKNKMTPAKLLTYNPAPKYSVQVQRLMREIDSDDRTP